MRQANTGFQHLDNNWVEVDVITLSWKVHPRSFNLEIMPALADDNMV
jgi:hypothetical protein